MRSFKRFVEDASSGLSPIPANNMGDSSSTAGTGGIDTVDPMLRREKFRRRRHPMSIRGLRHGNNNSRRR